MFRPQYYLCEKSEVNKKIIFECPFIAQNPFQTILVSNFTWKNFSKKIQNFYMFRPQYYLGEKSEVNKKSLLSALS